MHIITLKAHNLLKIQCKGNFTLYVSKSNVINQENKTRVTSLPWTTHLLVGRSLPPRRRPLSTQMDDVFTVDISLTGLANREI